jgi:DNA phosphorothioation-dependent restriction protein DptH
MCLDATMDERLIQSKSTKSSVPREIIGFASGLGSHGELNYTISTEHSSLSEIESRLSVQIKDLIPEIGAEQASRASHILVNKSRQLSGLSLVRSIGPSRYIHDLMAYTLIRICLQPMDIQGETLCDELIALDTFSHWFAEAKEGLRPDLMRLVAARTQAGNIHLYAQLIECKLGKQSTAHVEKARQQLECGLRHLMSVFHPRVDDVSSPYDQRYWWAQLQRLVASKSYVTNNVLIETTDALEKLAEGYFEMSWQGAAVTFWLDESDAEFVTDTTWPFDIDGDTLEIQHISCGIGLIHKVCCEEEKVPLKLGDKWITQGQVGVDGYGPSKIQTQAVDTEEHVDAVPDATGERKPYKFDEVNPPTTSDAGGGLKGQEIKTIVPRRIYLGANEAQRQVYWEFGHPELPNRHFLIFGRSGTGKTYAIQAILAELAANNQNSLIVDYTNGFEESQLQPETKILLKPYQHIVQIEPLPLNPFRRQLTRINDQDMPEKTITTANRVMSVFHSVYGLGDQQKSTLYQAGKHGLELYKEDMDLQRLVEILEQFETEGYSKDSTISLLSKIRPFVDGEPFGKEDLTGWRRFFEDKKHFAHIIQLAGSPKDFSTLVTEFTLIDLYWFARGVGNEQDPKVVVLDEIQNLDHRLGSPISLFLTEGRKFGLSMILATQTLRNLKEDARDRLFQASHKLFFKPADTEVQEYARILERGTGESAALWIRRLAALTKGECYSLGPSLNAVTNKLEEKALRIRITSLGDRIEHITKGSEA